MGNGKPNGRWNPENDSKAWPTDEARLDHRWKGPLWLHTRPQLSPPPRPV